ncbi:hypothetical protein CFC21_008062 [Triticum aestivum]|uniref:Uncharacterized protein n=2 Tax=Triticum aestivum TaxID=4565 RepID=A0A9R1DFH5_WHEAT|nr:hypothetical protein CFC21_008062 [Triticum aestivum]
MRKAPAAASKPKPRARAKPKAKASPDSLSSASSPSRSGGSPVAVGRGLLSPSSPATPKARSSLSPFATSTPASVSTVGDLRSLAASSLDSLKRRLDALHGDSARDLEASHSRISKRIKTQSCLKLAEEADKEHKKMDEKFSGRAEEMKVRSCRSSFDSMFDRPRWSCVLPCILNFVRIWTLKLRFSVWIPGIVQEVPDRGAVVFVSCVQGDLP